MLRAAQWWDSAAGLLFTPHFQMIHLLQLLQLRRHAGRVVQDALPDFGCRSDRSLRANLASFPPPASHTKGHTLTRSRSFTGMNPPYDDSMFYKIVTDDASGPGGAPAACSVNVAAALHAVYDLGNSAQGLALLTQSFDLCQPLQTASDAAALSQWLSDPWAFLAMGDFPYRSSYLLNGLHELPAWPVRAACRCSCI